MSTQQSASTPATPRDAEASKKIASALVPAVQRWQRDLATRAGHGAIDSYAKRLPLFCVIALPIAWLARDFAGLPFWVAPTALVAIGVLFAALRYATTRSRAAEQRTVALDCDRARATEDRISAALELASSRAPQHASLQDWHERLARLAIADGVAATQRLDAKTLSFHRARAARPMGLALFALFALAALLPFLPQLTVEDEAQRAADATTIARAENNAADAADAERREDAPAPANERSSTAAKKPEARATKSEKEPQPRQTEDQTPPAAAAASTGAGGSGAEEEPPNDRPRGAPKPSPASASGAGSPGGGSGESSAGAAESKPEAERKRNEATQKKPRKETPPKPRREEEQASSSAGTPSGASRGSGKMAPVANQRQDLQRSADRDDDPDVEEEEIEDEGEEQQQRGGVMPMTRQDQRSPARELAITGDGPPDQGRGGPTPPKKSRGTASLVLGIRLPDQVRGQPNPGTAKTNLEETPPRRQEHALLAASAARTAHSASVQRQRPPSARGSAWLHAYHELLQMNAAPPIGSADPSKNPEPR